jgi:hypothetical protein
MRARGKGLPVRRGPACEGQEFARVRVLVPWLQWSSAVELRQLLHLPPPMGGQEGRGHAVCTAITHLLLTATAATFIATSDYYSTGSGPRLTALLGPKHLSG